MLRTSTMIGQQPDLL